MKTIDEYMGGKPGGGIGNYLQDRGGGIMRSIGGLLQAISGINNTNDAAQKDAIYRNALAQYGESNGLLPKEVPDTIDTSGTPIGDVQTMAQMREAKPSAQDTASMDNQMEQAGAQKYGQLPTQDIMSLMQLHGQGQKAIGGKGGSTGDPQLDAAMDILKNFNNPMSMVYSADPEGDKALYQQAVQIVRSKAGIYGKTKQKKEAGADNLK